MKAYKGFKKDMTCRGFQFKEGKTYEENRAELCETGFHACEDPLDCLQYYEPANSIYREVELEDVSPEKKEDSKRVGKKIRIGAELDVAGLVKGHFDYVMERTTEAIEKGDAEAATAGYAGAATAGECGAATSRGASASGENGISVARGNDVKVKGGLGAVLIVVEEQDQSYDIAAWKSAVVDGETIKADTWYQLKDGDFKEVKEETK